LITNGTISGVPDGFDLTTNEILPWELENIQNALEREAIDITNHAIDEAANDHIPLVKLLEAILVGRPTSKDLPGNQFGRVPGINFEHVLDDGRWYRVKAAWDKGYIVITTHTF
jgi:hypothetical protein